MKAAIATFVAALALFVAGTTTAADPQADSPPPALTRDLPEGGVTSTVTLAVPDMH